MSVAMADAAHEALDEFSATLTKLMEEPGNYELHVDSVALAKRLQLVEELEQVRELLANRFVPTDRFWLDWIKDAQSQPTEDYASSGQAVLDLYDRALSNFSTPLLCKSKAAYVAGQYFRARGFSPPDPGDEPEVDPEAASDPVREAFWTEDLVNGLLAQVVGACQFHLTQSDSVWRRWRGFQESLIEQQATPDRLERLRDTFLARLSIPHQGFNNTFSAYSTFVTQRNDAAEYESRMAHANEIAAPARAAWEKREMEEVKLGNAAYAPEAYEAYIDAEARPPPRKARKGDPPLDDPDLRAQLRIALFERAVQDQRDRPEFWVSYLSYLSESILGDDDTEDERTRKLGLLYSTADRACRAIPWSGELWCMLMRAAERAGQEEEVEGIFARAMGTTLLDGRMDDLVKVYTCRASFHRHLLKAVGQDNPEVPGPTDILLEGIEAVAKAEKKGDPAFRLEKYAGQLLEQREQYDEGIAMWRASAERNSYALAGWTGLADFCVRTGRIDDAREVYEACNKKRLDYSEYYCELRLAFEEQYGTVVDYEIASLEVRNKLRGVAAFRQRQYDEQQAQQPVADGNDRRQVETVSNGAADRGQKRPAASATSEGDVDGARKRAKLEPEKELKRDREHSTVLVGNLPKGTSDSDLERLFSDCGAIREIKVYAAPNDAYALVEFVDKDSVLPAQTKDKKRIAGCEIDVHINWKSTLFLTNFPEKMDDKEMRAMFEPYGTILETRWPSKRYKNKRRFCYLQFASQESTTRALELNGRELEPGHPFEVKVSDPAVRKTRSDAKANDRELYINNLSKYTKEIDLRRVFERFGTIKAIRMELDEQGLSKKFAFVDFEDEADARAALAANNAEVRKRNMSVVMAQARQASGFREQSNTNTGAGRKADTRNRSVVASGLPDGIQEALVQQAFETHGPVRQVDLLGDGMAVVQFENIADLGKLLLLPEGDVKIDDHVLSLTEGNVPPKPASAASTTVPSTSVSTGFIPRNFSARGSVPRGRGRGRGGFVKPRAGIGARATESSTASSSTGATKPAANEGLAQDAFRAMLSKGK